MNLPVRARGYDLFKLIIAIILLLLLFYLLWRPVPQIPSPGTEMPTLTSPPPASITVRPSLTVPAATTIAPSPATETLTATPALPAVTDIPKSEEHTSELQSQSNLVCRLLREKKNIIQTITGELGIKQGEPTQHGPFTLLAVCFN